MLERLRTSFIVPKLIFYTTVALGVMTIGLAYAYITIDPQVILNESLIMEDKINAVLNP
jgi:hypothetical protein